MGKYELAVVVNAQIDDEARTAVVDRCKELITRFGGTVGEVDDWGKKKLAYEIHSKLKAPRSPRSRASCASWITSSDICA